MRIKLVTILSIITAATMLLACGGTKTEEPIVNAKPRKTFVKIGTGGITGVYYPTGGSIAKMVNEKDEYNMKVAVEATAGSVFNINAIGNGDLEFGIASSDMQYQAFTGQGEWKGKAQNKLRSVFSIHPEAVTVVAAVDADINNLLDLKGKRVNIGNPGSGTLSGATVALEKAGLNIEEDIKAESVKPADASDLLQDEKIDAFFYVVGHPNGAVKQATAGRRKVKFVPIPHLATKFLYEEYPYYSPTVISIDQYEQAENTKDVETFGVNATLVTRADVPEKVVYAITKEVFENLEEFKKLHEAYRHLTKESMMQGLSAPIHPGAQKYFDEIK